MTQLFRILAIASWLAWCASAVPAFAQPKLKVLADTPLRAGLLVVAENFRRESGQEIEFGFGPSPVIMKRLTDGETADVLVAQPQHIASLVASGKVPAGDYPVLGRVGLGLAVRADAPARRIGTVEEVRQVLLEADTLVTNTIIPGDLFLGVVQKLGLAEPLKAKVVRLPPGPGLYERITQGTGNDVTAGMYTILKETKGLRVLGPLPAELQPYQAYAAAALSGASLPAQAASFVRFLHTAAAMATLRESGVE